MAELSLAELGQQLKKDFLAITADLVAAEDWQAKIERSWDTPEFAVLQTTLESLANLPGSLTTIYAGLTSGFVPALADDTQAEQIASPGATSRGRDLPPTPPMLPDASKTSKEAVQGKQTSERKQAANLAGGAISTARLSATRRPLAPTQPVQPGSSLSSPYQSSRTSADLFLTPTQPADLFPLQTLPAQFPVDSSRHAPAATGGKLEYSELPPTQKFTTTPATASARFPTLQVASVSLENVPDELAEFAPVSQLATEDFFEISAVTEESLTRPGSTASPSLAEFARRLAVEDLDLEAENEEDFSLPQSGAALSPTVAQSETRTTSAFKVTSKSQQVGNPRLARLRPSAAIGSLADFALNSDAAQADTAIELLSSPKGAISEQIVDFTNLPQNEGSAELHQLVTQAEQAAKSANSLTSNIPEVANRFITESTEFSRNSSEMNADLPTEQSHSGNAGSLGSLKQLANRLQEDFEQVSETWRSAELTPLHPPEKSPALSEATRSLYDQPEESNLKLQNMPAENIDFDAIVEALTKEIWRDYRRFYGN